MILTKFSIKTQVTRYWFVFSLETLQLFFVPFKYNCNLQFEDLGIKSSVLNIPHGMVL